MPIRRFMLYVEMKTYKMTMGIMGGYSMFFWLCLKPSQKQLNCDFTLHHYDENWDVQLFMWWTPNQIKNCNMVPILSTLIRGEGRDDKHGSGTVGRGQWASSSLQFDTKISLLVAIVNMFADAMKNVLMKWWQWLDIWKYCRGALFGPNFTIETEIVTQLLFLVPSSSGPSVLRNFNPGRD